MPVINFNFCGTRTSAADNGVATNQAIKKFEDHLILTGVGALEKTDKEANIYYPTPGTYYRGADGKRVKSYFRMAGSYAYAGSILTPLRAGAVRGSGEEDNLNFSLGEVADWLSKNSNTSEPLTVNISGFSRGGAAAIRFANRLYQKYGEKITVNLYIQDPNAGYGRHGSLRKISVPPNVANAHFTFSKDDRSRFLRSFGLRQYEFLGKETRISSIALPGNHGDQEYLRKKGWPDAAKLNGFLMEQFFNGYGAKLCEGKTLNEQPEIVLGMPQPEDQRNLYGFSEVSNQGKGLHAVMASLMPQNIDPVNIRQQWRQWQGVPGISNLLEAVSAFRNSELKSQGYQFAYHLVADLNQIKYDKNDRRYSQINDTANKAAVLINSLNARKNNDGKIDHQKALEALKNFERTKHCGPAARSREVFGKVVGAAVGVIFGAVFGSVFGCFSGMLRVKTGFIGGALMGAACGAAKGFSKTYGWTSRNITGETTHRAFVFARAAQRENFIEKTAVKLSAAPASP